MANQTYHTIVFGKKSLRKESIIYLKKEDLQIPHGEDYKIALGELCKIKNSQIHNIDFLAQFEYEKNSMWWFIFPSIIPVYKNLINFIISFQQLIDEVKPQLVKVEDDFGKLNLIKQLCKKNKIKLGYSRLRYSKFYTKQKLIKNSQKSRFSRITSRKIEKRKKMFFDKMHSVPSVKNKIVFAVPTIYRRKIFDYKTGSSRNGEYIQQSIIDLLKTDDIVGIDLDYTFKGDFKKFSERLYEKIPWFPIENLISKYSTRTKLSFLEKFEKLLYDSEFQKLFVYNDVDFWDNIEESFKKMSYAPNLPLYLDLIKSTSDFFKKNPPKVIFLPYETGPYALSIILACQKLGIKTIGVSHAIIPKYTPMYSHFSCKSEINPLGHPIPDVTLVFGDYAKKVLVDDGYPSNKVISFGNPAFFNLEKIEEVLARKSPRKKYNIQNEDFVILFTSGRLQPKYVADGNYDYDVQVWNRLVSEFANKKNYFLILKPHPQETDTIYQTIAEKANAKNSLIINGELFELLFISNVVVSVYSTTMMDALCFKKPVIQVKFKDETHPIPFEKYGAILTTKVNNLSSAIISILENSSIKEKLQSNREQLLREQYGLPKTNPEKLLKHLISS